MGYELIKISIDNFYKFLYNKFIKAENVFISMFNVCNNGRKLMSDVTPAVDNLNINLVDLQNIVKIVDVAAERGSFKGNELSAVGSVRDKISKFLEVHMPKTESVDEVPTATEEKANKKVKGKK